MRIGRFSRPRSTSFTDGQRPYLTDYRAVQVRRGTEDLLVKKSWTLFRGLTKTMSSAEEQLTMRQKKAGTDATKLDAICRMLVPHISVHKRCFWENLSTA